MRVVIQRVSEASVSVQDKKVSAIGEGLLVLVGIENGDNVEDAKWLAAKTVGLRIFPDDNGVMNLSVTQIHGEILAISQFTLTASTRKGNRPSYIRAANQDTALPLYEAFCKEIGESSGISVKQGVFGAEMKVSLVNCGPTTIIMDSRLKE